MGIKKLVIRLAFGIRNLTLTCYNFSIIKTYWQLKEKPFQNTPDPRFIYLSAQHEDALMKLSYCVTQGLGCAMLTGVFGCGKTLLGKTLLNDLGKDKVRAAFITSPSYSEPVELLRAMVRGLSPQGLPDKKN